MTLPLAHDVFAPHLGAVFTVAVPGSDAVELRLVEVSEPRRSARFESFSMLFCGPAELRLADVEHTFHHDVLGQFGLFIAAVWADGDGIRYEAVFNRSLDQ